MRSLGWSPDPIWPMFWKEARFGDRQTDTRARAHTHTNTHTRHHEQRDEGTDSPCQKLDPPSQSQKEPTLPVTRSWTSSLGTARTHFCQLRDKCAMLCSSAPANWGTSRADETWAASWGQNAKSKASDHGLWLQALLFSPQRWRLSRDRTEITIGGLVTLHTCVSTVRLGQQSSDLICN